MPQPVPPTKEADFTFAQDRPFHLSAGGELQPVTLRYAIYGEMTSARNNVILVCHALSGSARAADWWEDMFGPDGVFDLDRHCVVCANVLGSCYGSTGPNSINPKTGRPYGGDFPPVSIADIVRSQVLLLDHLGVEQLDAVVGGSIGGMQALEWAARYPERLRRCVAIGAAPVGAMALAMSHLQRQAIRNDPAWQNGHYPPGQQPAVGLATARAIAMCTYKSAELFEERYGRKPNRNGEDPHTTWHGRFDVAGYLDYQGQIFVRRFDANSYLVVSRAMDTFDLGRTPEQEEEALRRIRAEVLLIGISSDWLFPCHHVRALAERMKAVGVQVRYEELESSHGHDGFLADPDRLVALVGPMLQRPCAQTVAHG
jgi:homoserine O-acetyltransferase